jgi:voltage-gated potassium channel
MLAWKRFHAEILHNSLWGKSLADLKIREISGVNIVGIKIGGTRYIFNPDPKMIISRNDQLFVLGNPGQIKKLKEMLEM